MKSLVQYVNESINEGNIPNRKINKQKVLNHFKGVLTGAVDMNGTPIKEGDTIKFHKGDVPYLVQYIPEYAAYCLVNNNTGEFDELIGMYVYDNLMNVVDSDEPRKLNLQKVTKYCSGVFTGVSDMNGVPIKEGDKIIFDGKDDIVYTVTYDAKYAAFCVVDSKFKESEFISMHVENEDGILENGEVISE